MTHSASSGLKNIECGFCRGTGRNPHFRGSCPVCKGKGENQVKGEYMTCGDCRGSGQKRGTTLTCYICGGLGVVPGEEKPKALGNERELIENLKAENKRLQKRLSKAKSPPDLPAGKAGADRSREKDGMESAIGSYCEDCVLGENKECWDIECALAPYSPVAEAVK